MHTDDSLEDLRESIDHIDTAIMAMFAERFKVTDRVGRLKARNGLPAKDEVREAQQHQRLAFLAGEFGVDAEVARAYLTTMQEQVVQRHLRVSSE